MSLFPSFVKPSLASTTSNTDSSIISTMNTLVASLIPLFFTLIVKFTRSPTLTEVTLAVLLILKSGLYTGTVTLSKRTVEFSSQ